MNRTKAGWILIWAAALAGPLSASEAMAPEVTTSALDRMEYLPQVAYNSVHDEYLVVWHDLDPASTPARRILGRRLDRYGRPRGNLVSLGPNDTRDRAQAAVAYDPVQDRYLLVYAYDYYGNASDWDVRGRFVSWNLASLGSEFGLGATGSHEWMPRVDFSYLSGKFLVAWTLEPAAGFASVRGALVSTGSVVEFAIASSPTADRARADVAYQPYGDNFLVVYDSGSDIFGTIVTAAGAVGAEIGIAAWPDPESNPRVASCDNFQYLVAWQSTTAGGGNEIYGRFLYGDGTIQTAPVYFAGTTAHEQRPDVACIDAGIDYLVAYEKQYTNGQFGVSGRRISATQILRPEFAIRPVFSGETGVTFRPQIAGSGAGWISVWEHQRQGSSFQDIHSRVAWQLFTDGFEWGNTNQWSSTQP